MPFNVSKCTSTKRFETPKMSTKAIQGVMIPRSKEPCSSAAALPEFVEAVQGVGAAAPAVSLRVEP